MGKSEITRDAFLDAALYEASLSGIARLTLAPVAAAAGRSKGGLLRHFPSKESLQIAVLDHAFMCLNRPCRHRPACRDCAPLWNTG